MYRAVTRQISRSSVEPVYLDDESDPDEITVTFWAYAVEIANLGR